MSGLRFAIVASLGLGLVASARGGEKPKEEKVAGYAEWRKGKVLIVDGQPLRANAATKLKLPKGVASLDALPLGYEVSAKGLRATDGVLLATELEAKPNTVSMFEDDARTATAELEAKWLSRGRVYQGDEESALGDLHTEGREVERVRRIVRRLLPPYLEPDGFRIYVVESDDWNAFACANGMIVVYTQLLHDMDDDEIAIILGHEMVHATHEHTRREFKKAFWGHLGFAAVVAATGDMKDKTGRDALRLLGLFAAKTWQNGYGRGCEDQADRVGLRYAYEAGYDVTKAPNMWRRFARKYGEAGKVVNFFFGDHSLSTARALKLETELGRNYPDADERHAAMENGDVRYREDRRRDDADEDEGEDQDDERAADSGTDD